MSIENLLKRIRETNKFFLLPDSEKKSKLTAMKVVSGICYSVIINTSMGLISKQELIDLSQDTDQEKRYKDMLPSFLTGEEFISDNFSDLTLAQQTDIGLRHAKWLVNKFELEFMKPSLESLLDTPRVLASFGKSPIVF